MSALPGLPLPGDPAGYPAKDEVADYLQRYAGEFDLPVFTGDRVLTLERHLGSFLATTQQGQTITARAAVVATGAFQEPLIPPFAQNLAPEVAQYTAKTYRNPNQIPSGRVLVVGSGATGRQVAHELAETHETWISKGSWLPLAPQRVLGKDVIWCFSKLGALTADKESLYGRFVRQFDATPGLHLALPLLRHRGVRVVPRTTGAEGRTVYFRGGGSARFDSIIWAMGYRDNCSWIRIAEALDADGRCLERRGRSPVPGLFYVGRSWQNSRASALLCGAGKDAAEIVQAVSLYLNQEPSL